MAAAPVLTLLGVPVLRAGSEEVIFTTERPFQLLAYLACQRRWLRRDELADILWPDHDAAQSRSNLRKVLLLAGRVHGVGEIERQGDLLRWSPDSDLRRFEAACEERRFAEAVELGAAPLLEGFDGAFSGAGGEWLLGERQRLTARWQAACMQRLDEIGERPVDVARLARRMLDRDPLDEAAVQALARAHIALGEGESATAAIAAYARRLADEFGLEPTAALRELANAALSTTRPMALGTTAPLPGSAFIGRRIELRRLMALLEEPGCRLLTLTGPGGIGKTSTAASIAARLAPAIVESVAAVPLADLTEASQVPARVAARLDVTLSGSAEPWSQIGAAIGDRSLALVLDNAEQLEIGAALERLLDAAPRLKLLVTSRSLLGVAAETAFALEGLPLPDDDETDVEVLRRCDAVALFEARALAASRAFDLEAQAADVVRLVHHVEGLPLAIELAAIWTRLLPVAEIADELARSVDLLDGYGATERGLRASFAQSWRLLSDSERACLPQLALLPGDFGRDMAQRIAGASLPVVAALVDKSLLRSDGSGRFSMHPLLRRCAAEHADPDDQVMTRVAGFVARWLGEFADPQTTIGSDLLRAIERELAHVRAAWAWALLRRDASVIASIARPLSTFFEERGMWAEGIASLTQAVAALAGTDAAGARARALSCRGLAALQYRSGALESAEASAREVLAFAQRAGDSHMLMSALNTIGLSLWQRGRYEEARPYYEQALQRAELEGSGRAIAAFSSNIAIIDKSLGRYEQALAAYERVLASERGIGQLASTLNNIANVERALGRPERAVARLNEALVVCAQHGLATSRPFVTVNLGLSHMEMGEPKVATTWLEGTLTEARRMGEPLIEMAALLALAQLDLGAGDAAGARTRAWPALALADRAQSMAARVKCAAVLGEILAHEGRLAEGLALMRWAIAQPTLDRLDRDSTERRVAALLARHGGEPGHFDLAADTPLATVLAIVAADR